MATLKDLAAEREQRTRERQKNLAPETSQKQNKPAHLGVLNSRPSAERPSVLSGRLSAAHRSIRMAHSIGLIICIFSIFLILFPWVVRTQILISAFFLFGIWLARCGGALVHSCLPSILREGAAPTFSDIEVHDKCLFLPSIDGEMLSLF